MILAWLLLSMIKEIIKWSLFYFRFCWILLLLGHLKRGIFVLGKTEHATISVSLLGLLLVLQISTKIAQEVHASHILQGFSNLLIECALHYIRSEWPLANLQSKTEEEKTITSKLTFTYKRFH